MVHMLFNRWKKGSQIHFRCISAMKVSCNTDIATIRAATHAISKTGRQNHRKEIWRWGDFTVTQDKSGSYTSGFASGTKRGWPLHMKRENKNERRVKLHVQLSAGYNHVGKEGKGMRAWKNTSNLWLDFWA